MWVCTPMYTCVCVTSEAGPSRAPRARHWPAASCPWSLLGGGGDRTQLGFRPLGLGTHSCPLPTLPLQGLSEPPRQLSVEAESAF